MKTYRIEGGSVQIGMGDVVALADAQINPRRMHLEIMSTVEGGAICRARSVLAFKAGEVIGLAAPPPKAMMDRMVEVAEQPAAPSAEQSAPQAREAPARKNAKHK